MLHIRLGESQPGDVQGQLQAALAYIEALEKKQVEADAPSGPSSLCRAKALPAPGTLNSASLCLLFNTYGTCSI